MKWNKLAIVGIAAIVLLSYAYQTTQESKLSNKVKKEKRDGCSTQKAYDCGLIAKFHDACFTSSYRAELRIREFHRDEYDDCMARMISSNAK